jgi:hypothetical protein
MADNLKKEKRGDEIKKKCSNGFTQEDFSGNFTQGPMLN